MHHVKSCQNCIISTAGFIVITTSPYLAQGRDHRKNMKGGSESLRISFLEALYGFNKGVIFEPMYLLGYEFDGMTVSGAVCVFY